MEIITCLVGLSGTGKTTVAHTLEKQYGYNVIKSYTTRPPRSANEYGHTFVDIDMLNVLNASDLKDEIIAYSRYGTQHYWVLRAQYKNKKHSIFIVDTRGVKMLLEAKNKFKFKVNIIYLTLDTAERLRRVKQELAVTNMSELTQKQIDELANERVLRELDQYICVKCDYIIYNKSSDTTALLINDILMTMNENNVK